ncbi:hypothetical protein LTR08_008939 [Meristemomyces frigidus]|nr:hypothetical protein LTR08_008939 [Meristemomyces frigidus]
MSKRVLAPRGSGLVAQTLHARTPAFSAARTAASRRTPVTPRPYSDASSQRHHRLRRDGILLPFALRSPFLPASLPAGVRHISFKEMREERARQRAGEAASGAASTQKARPEPETAAKPEPSGPSAAEAAFESARAEGARQWAKEEEQQQQREQQQQNPDEPGAEDGEGQKNDKRNKKGEPETPPHGGKTPWQVFTETLQAEFKASKEWEQGTKQLSGSITDFTQNPNVQRARSAYAKAAEATATTTGKVFLGTAGAIGKSAAWTWQTPVVQGVRRGAGAVGSGLEKATRPVRETEAFKNVKDVIDDGASQRYGGWTEKEERRRRREEREALHPSQTPEVFDEDPLAGTHVTLHKDAAWKESWRSFRDNSPVMQRFFGLGSTYRESENPLISTARAVSDRFAGFFAENETARVIKKFREMDPSFQLEPWLQEMRTYILPEVLEAYVTGDVKTLKLWLSAAQYSVYAALMAQYTTAGLQSSGQILDIRNVDILNARILEPGDIPVFVIMCRTQEVHVYRNKKTGVLAAGMEDKVQQVTYAIGVTRIPEDVANPETRGWKFIELQKSGRDYI